MSVQTKRLIPILAAFVAGLVLCLGIILYVGGPSSGAGGVQAAAIGGPFNLID